MQKGNKRKIVSRTISRPLSPLDALVYRLDAVAYEIEAKWGTDVIWQLADATLAGKFMRALDKLDEAIKADDYDATSTNVDNCIKGWRAMDASATKNGYVPDSAKCRKVKSPGGVYYVFCATDLESAQHVASNPVDAPITFSLGQAAAALERMSVLYNQSNEAIRGITDDAPKLKPIGRDEIPF